MKVQQHRYGPRLGVPKTQWVHFRPMGVPNTKIHYIPLVTAGSCIIRLRLVDDHRAAHPPRNAAVDLLHWHLVRALARRVARRSQQRVLQKLGSSRGAEDELRAHRLPGWRQLGRGEEVRGLVGAIDAECLTT